MRDLTKPIQRRAVINARKRAVKYCIVTTALSLLLIMVANIAFINLI